MSTAARLATRAVSTAFGLVMVASAAVQADGPGLIAAVVAAAAVLAGSVFRPAATIAVLLTVSVIVLADATPVAVTSPTVVGAVGFAAAGLAAASLPLELPWVPLLAPLAVLALYVLVTRPFWAT